MLRRLHAWLAGTDGPGKTALPLGEFLHPLPLVALVLLALNDHYLKHARIFPHWFTGKLSDFTGLLFFPLLLTALGDTLAYFVARVTGARLDFSLRRWKIVVACLATAAVFTPLELSAAYGRFYTETLGRIGFPSETYMDLTDLLALVMIPVAGWLAWQELGRVPLGRLEVIARAHRAPADPEDVRRTLADVRRVHERRGDTRRVAAVDGLAGAYATWLETQDAKASATAAASVNDALRTLRS